MVDSDLPTKLSADLAARFESRILPVLSILFSTIVYAVVLFVGVPKEISLAPGSQGSLLLFLVVPFLLLVAYYWSGWIGTLIGLTLTLVVFGLPLSGLWTSGISTSALIGGLLPFSDAGGYFNDARRLLDGVLFPDFSARRSMFAGMLAAVLGLTGRNLQLTLAILVAVTAISCYLAGREVQLSHGTAAGVFS